MNNVVPMWKNAWPYTIAFREMDQLFEFRSFFQWQGYDSYLKWFFVVYALKVVDGTQYIGVFTCALIGKHTNRFIAKVWIVFTIFENLPGIFIVAYDDNFAFLFVS